MSGAKLRGDVYHTPDWVVADMVKHFRPTGRVLDPCRGDGAFANAIPGCEWCEINEGRDFFDWTEPVDWVISNPPYSKTRGWFRHSYTIADNLLYLIPLRQLFGAYWMMREADDFGGIRAIRVYGTGTRLGFPMGNAVGAVHIQRGYIGPLDLTYYADTCSTEVA